MRKAGNLFLLLFTLCVLLTVNAFASGEPSAEPSGEPASVEADVRTAEFDVTFLVNGEEYRSACVGVTVEGDKYTFDVSALLELLGVELTFDEDTDVASLTPVEGGIMAALLSRTAQEKDDASGEPLASEEPAVPETVASGEPAASAGSGEDPSVSVAPTVRPAIADIRKHPVGDFFRSVH